MYTKYTKHIKTICIKRAYRVYRKYYDKDIINIDLLICVNIRVNSWYYKKESSGMFIELLPILCK